MRTIVLVLPLAASALLTGCGGSSSTAAPAASSTPPVQSTATNTVGGATDGVDSCASYQHQHWQQPGAQQAHRLSDRAPRCVPRHP